jgi:hypothetical protein
MHQVDLPGLVLEKSARVLAFASCNHCPQSLPSGKLIHGRNIEALYSSGVQRVQRSAFLRVVLPFDLVVLAAREWGKIGGAPGAREPRCAPTPTMRRPCRTLACARPVEVLGEVDVLMPRDPLVLERAPAVPVLRVGQRAHDRAELEAGAPRRVNT